MTPVEYYRQEIELMGRPNSRFDRWDILRRGCKRAAELPDMTCVWQAWDSWKINRLGRSARWHWYDCYSFERRLRRIMRGWMPHSRDRIGEQPEPLRYG